MPHQPRQPSPRHHGITVQQHKVIARASRFDAAIAGACESKVFIVVNHAQLRPFQLGFAQVGDDIGFGAVVDHDHPVVGVHRPGKHAFQAHAQVIPVVVVGEDNSGPSIQILNRGAQCFLAVVPGVVTCQLDTGCSPFSRALGQSDLKLRHELGLFAHRIVEIRERLELGQLHSHNRLPGTKVLVKLHRVSSQGQRSAQKRDAGCVEACQVSR